ncbi:MAG: GTP-binding protein Era [Gammaproteobacteria bacterium]|jgi:GTP-binding protein Era
MSDTLSRCGSIAIVGRPNVGKSTLLNRIVGQKISITSRKPQTTWYQILGIRTIENVQMIFVDTPGWQHRPQRQINRVMNRQIDAALSDVDVVIMVADARGWHKDDAKVIALIEHLERPKILVLNKHDQVVNKQQLLPLIGVYQQRLAFDEILPTNSLTGDNVAALVQVVGAKLPAGPHQFPDDQVTPHTERFIVGELLREKLIRGLGEELPYTVSVVIAKFSDAGSHIDIDAEIWVEREGQKGIVIGAKGSRLKAIASSARKDIEVLLDRRVYLQTWVKIKGKWTDDINALRELNLND